MISKTETRKEMNSYDARSDYLSFVSNGELSFSVKTFFRVVYLLRRVTVERVGIK